MLDGYDVSSGTYDVPANTGGVPSATLNNNGYDGLSAGGSNTSVTVEGGQFNGNFNSGIETGAGATVTISGGTFNNNSNGVTANAPSQITINGGEFTGDGYAALANCGAITVYGGNFDGSFGNDFAAFGGIENGTLFQATIDLFGAFPGLSVGQSQTLPDYSSGSFYGQLQDNSAGQTYTYVSDEGAITLHDTLIPEPASFCFIVPVGAGLLARRLRLNCFGEIVGLTSAEV